VRGAHVSFEDILNDEPIWKRINNCVLCVISFLVFHCMKESIISTKKLDLICSLS
jgi:hypothetical protein